MTPGPVLEIDGISKHFGGLQALNEVSASFEDDTIHGIIGPNGAGKTTLFNVITGVLQPTAGEVYLNGDSITEASPHEIARKGLIRSYQSEQIFPKLTVTENVAVGVRQSFNEYNFLQKDDTFSDIDARVHEVLDIIGLDRRDVLAENLGHGEQRMLELAISLGPDPDVLLLDEPTSGINAEETAKMVPTLTELASEATLILIEHKMSVMNDLADRVLVLHKGEVLADGPLADVKSDSTVREVYLGSKNVT